MWKIALSVSGHILETYFIYNLENVIFLTSIKSYRLYIDSCRGVDS